MKKLLTVLITCSLALAANALAQQEDASPTPDKKQHKGEHRPGQGNHPAREAKPANEARPRQNADSSRKARVEAKAEAQTKQASPDAANAAPSTAPEAQGQEAASNRKQQRAQMKKERSAPNEAASAATTAKSPSTSAKTKTSATTAAQAKTASAPAPKANGKVKKPAPQVVEKIKTQHANFKAQARPETVPSVTFNQSYRIQGADQWQGAQYGVFRSYRPARHDQSYYRSHYSRVEVIGGGAYYFSNGYWYPAWGYNPSAQYYAYDGPIYVGSRGVPPDRVIADVQAILQEQGYYKGEVDGLLGPLTRQALTAYQTDAGLYPTAAIDEPTLSSLNLG